MSPPLHKPELRSPLANQSPTLADVCALHETHHVDPRVDRIEKAFEFANQVHAGAQRLSGDPYITHPLAVAAITAQAGLDEASIVAALLHDVIEDTGATPKQVEGLFPDDPTFALTVKTLVVGLTKLDGVKFTSSKSRKKADLRRMLVAVAADPRVLVVKLADRLHNMRTIDVLPADKALRIATETMEVFAPLAGRLGMNSLKEELEERAFAVVAPKRFAALTQALRQRVRGLEDEVELVVEAIKQAHGSDGKLDVSWRLKSLWSIDQKMQKAGVPLSGVYDVVGVRVCVDTVSDCYATLGQIHGLWSPVPGRFRDYIALPKSNLYQSLHTTINGPGSEPIEIQIRTHHMHEVAEMGVAAHWAYKEGDTPDSLEDVAWMRRLLDAEEDMEAVTSELAVQEIHCVTPKGELIVLPFGATPVDFAYQVHTEVGNRCVGARVNGSITALTTHLQDGDRVEILTSKNKAKGPNPTWANFVATSKARSRIRQFVRRARTTIDTAKARQDILDALSARCSLSGVSASPLSDETLDPALASIASRWGLTDAKAVVSAVAAGHISPASVASRLAPQVQVSSPHPTSPVSSTEVIVGGQRGLEVHLARCCNPSPPSVITGWVTRNRGVSVHRSTCTNVVSLVASRESRVVAVDWASQRTPPVLADVFVECFDQPGVFAAVASTVAEFGADIRSTSSDSDHQRGTQNYRVAVSDADSLSVLSDMISEVDGVIDVVVSRV